MKATVASVVALLYGVAAFLAELPAWIFRPLFYAPEGGRWIEAEAAAIGNVLWVSALFYLCGAAHGSAQLWFGRHRSEKGRDTKVNKWIDQVTTLCPLAGVALGFIVSHLTGFWAFSPGARWLELGIQGWYALLVVSACRHDLVDTYKFWKWHKEASAGP